MLAVFLVGFMGSGKSTIGQELARRLGWDFVDLDQRIEAREQRSIPDIFERSGEPAFRQAETAALRELMETLPENSVVALGGGAFGPTCNRELISKQPSVFLEASMDELWRRSSEDGTVRPLRRSREQFTRLYEERLPCYQQASITVDTSGKDISSICLEIEHKLNLPARSPGDESARTNLANSGRGGIQ